MNIKTYLLPVLYLLLQQTHLKSQISPPVASVVTSFDKQITYSNVSLNKTGKNYYFASPGESFSISFDWVGKCLDTPPWSGKMFMSYLSYSMYGMGTNKSLAIMYSSFSPGICADISPHHVTGQFNAPSVPGEYSFVQVLSYDTTYPRPQGGGMWTDVQVSNPFAVVLVLGESWKRNGNKLFYNEGFVGIGTNNPATILDVNGAISVHGKTVIDSTGKWLGDKTGMTGPSGSNGSLWYTGQNNPSNALGNNNDLFLNTISDSLFQKLNGTWQPKVSLKGSAGVSGSLWYSGTADPSNSSGNDNDFYLNTTTYNLFQKLNGSWQAKGKLKGEQGPPGAEGSCSTIACTIAATAAGTTAGGTAGAIAGTTAGTEAGGIAGTTSGATAGGTAGATAGTQAGTTAGRTAGSEAGRQAAQEELNKPAGGDVSGNYNNLSVIKLRGNSITSATPQSGQLLKWLNNAWTPSNPDTVKFKAGKGITINKDTISTNLKFGWNVDSLGRDSSSIYVSIKGNTGIGTSRPQAMFHVQGGKTGSADSAFAITKAGNVGIGTLIVDDKFKLSVKGEIRAKAVTVESGWADYVFMPDYELMPLGEVEKFITGNKRLPGVPSEKEIVQKGLNLGETQKIMMSKIEELTLYIIELKKQNEALANLIKELKNK